MSERKTLTGGDWAAVGTFLLGALVAVLMGLALLRGVDGAQGTGALAARIAASVGALPALVAGAGIAFLGARAFLTGARGRLVLDMLGVLGMAAGLSVILGALWTGAGGALGAWTGGNVAQIAHAAVGVLLGAIVAFGAAYLVWMREDPAAAARLAPPRRTTPAPPRSDDGVTIAESAMLFPDEDDVAPPQPIAVVAPARPLYPEDVRLKGQVPSGARPLTGASVPAAEPQPAVYRWTAPRAAPPVPLAAETAHVEMAEAATPALFEPPVAIVEEVLEEPEARALPPRPSWETTGLAEDDEPVDAYGTPLSLVEKARRDATEPAPQPTLTIPRELDALPLEEDTDQDADAVAATADGGDEDEVDVIEVEIETAQAGTLDDEMDALEEEVAGAVDAPLAAIVDTEAEAEEDEDELVLDARAAVADAADAPAGLQPYQSEQDELLEELRARNTATRDWRDVQADAAASDPLMPEDLEDEYEEEFAEAAAELEIAASDDDDLDMGDDEDLADVEAPEPRQPEFAHAAPPATDLEGRSARPRPIAPSLFDSLEETRDEEPAQREVVLQPQAAVPAARAEKTPGRGIDPEKKLLVEVGCMFVERGRVAVSMLQRQYDMDFDQACRVLDDLQEMGLIGPYLGGKNRDILMTKEKWLEKVGSA